MEFKLRVPMRVISLIHTPFLTPLSTSNYGERWDETMFRRSRLLCPSHLAPSFQIGSWNLKSDAPHKGHIQQLFICRLLPKLHPTSNSFYEQRLQRQGLDPTYLEFCMDHWTGRILSCLCPSVRICVLKAPWNEIPTGIRAYLCISHLLVAILPHLTSPRTAMQLTVDSGAFNSLWYSMIMTAVSLVLHGVYVNLFVLSMYTLSRRKTVGTTLLRIASCMLAVVGSMQLALDVAGTVTLARVFQRMVYPKPLTARGRTLFPLVESTLPTLLTVLQVITIAINK
ncbi:hypothetical protein B0H14DRAFT_1193778 [Mycena olivaceomarginata]|nr:hypothetical protein B0H14DRAFT_1193778 [Mycena olivaceomarginata]